MFTPRSARVPLGLLIAALLVVAPCDASAAEFLFGNYVDGQSITRDSVTNGGATPVVREVADDFTPASGRRAEAADSQYHATRFPFQLRVSERIKGHAAGSGYS